MKKIVYKLINKFGFKVENKKKFIEREKELLKKYNINENFDLIFKSRKFIHSLNQKYSDFNLINQDTGFIVSFLNLKIFVESAEEFFILSEVFVENDYNFSANSKSIIIDIGANIGISSLFFSNLKWVDKIYSFEPVKATFEQASYNFSINDSICKVVSFKNIGLGGYTRKEFFVFNKLVKGNTGIRGELSPSYNNIQDSVKVEVQINDASEEILKILKDNTNKKIVVKMDCEGAEYEIFENLHKSGIISSIDVFMLEWHDKGAQMIEEILKNAGFEFFSKTLSPISGLIYAYKK